MELFANSLNLTFSILNLIMGVVYVTMLVHVIRQQKHLKRIIVAMRNRGNQTGNSGAMPSDRYRQVAGWKEDGHATVGGDRMTSVGSMPDLRKHRATPTSLTEPRTTTSAVVKKINRKGGAVRRMKRMDEIDENLFCSTGRKMDLRYLGSDVVCSQVEPPAGYLSGAVRTNSTELRQIADEYKTERQLLNDINIDETDYENMICRRVHHIHPPPTNTQIFNRAPTPKSPKRKQLQKLKDHIYVVT